MRRLRIAICDDEKQIRDMITQKISRICPGAEVMQYASGEEVLSDQEGVDILLLDIQMSGKNGIETAKSLRKRKDKVIIIFITALEEYVFQAFDVGAFHYLLKPFSDEKFFTVLRKAVKEWEEKRAVTEKESRFIIIKTGSVHTRVNLEDIIYAEVYDRKIMLHTTTEEMEYYGKMGDLEKMTGEDFFRSHRAFLIHLKYIVKYDAASVYLENGNKALLAKQKYSEFVKAYLKYNRRKGNK